jgi:hypothetical protein
VVGDETSFDLAKTIFGIEVWIESGAYSRHAFAVRRVNN